MWYVVCHVCNIQKNEYLLRNAFKILRFLIYLFLSLTSSHGIKGVDHYHTVPKKMHNIVLQTFLNLIEPTIKGVQQICLSVGRKLLVLTRV